MRCFYYDVASEASVPSSDPVELDAAEAVAQWEHLSDEPGTFFGVYTPSGLVVQFLWEDDEQVQIDIPLVDRRGSLQKLIPYEGTLPLLRSLFAEPPANPADDPDLKFTAWE